MGFQRKLEWRRAVKKVIGEEVQDNVSERIEVPQGTFIQGEMKGIVELTEIKVLCRFRRNSRWYK